MAFAAPEGQPAKKLPFCPVASGKPVSNWVPVGNGIVPGNDCTKIIYPTLAFGGGFTKPLVSLMLHKSTKYSANSISLS
jgi:hypothetical protein